jgi:hypothetical protein
MVPKLQQKTAWVQQQGDSHIPKRLSHMKFEAKDMRLPLFGATGEEVQTTKWDRNALGCVCLCVCVEGGGGRCGGVGVWRGGGVLPSRL